MEVRNERTTNSEETLYSRASRNKELYEQIDNVELENFEVETNATVIAENKNGNIDVDKIKNILDTHYKDTTKSPVDVKFEEIPEKKDETKEYDINVIIDKAKEDKEDDYSIDRVQRLHNTQYEILNALKEKNSDEDDNFNQTKSESDVLKSLIDTIKLNEEEIRKQKEKTDELTDPLDLFEDLKGSDDTEVTSVIKEKEEDFDTTDTDIIKAKDDDFDTTDTDIIKAKDDEKFDTTDTNIDTKELFTEKNSFKSKDFDEKEDDEETEKSNVFIKIIILILTVIFIVGIVVLIKSFL